MNMYFVVALELDTGGITYKVFQKYADAERHQLQAYFYETEGRILHTKRGERALIATSRLYRISARSRESAVAKVADGAGELLKDSENQFDIDIDIQLLE